MNDKPQQQTPPASAYRASALRAAIDAGLQQDYNEQSQAIVNVDKLISSAVKIENYLKNGKEEANG